MSIRVAALGVVGALLVGGVCSADWLVLRGGKKIETTGQWLVQGNLLTVRQPSSGPKRVMLSIVDFDATLRANPRVARRADSTWHVSPEGIKRLQEAARQQEAMAAQLRAGQQAGKEEDAMGGKPRKGAAGGGDAAAGPTRAQARNQGSRGSGFDALERCKIWQDQPKLYSDCLAGH